LRVDNFVKVFLYISKVKTYKILCNIYYIKWEINVLMCQFAYELFAQDS